MLPAVINIFEKAAKKAGKILIRDFGEIENLQIQSKSVGDFVKAGDHVAVIGNSGELTSGPHLHFELWHNGGPVDPENYISF